MTFNVKPSSEPPVASKARQYIHAGIFHKGGWREGLGGLWHKTLPYIAGRANSMTLLSFAGFVMGLMLFVSIALYPIILRKALMTSAGAVPVNNPPMTVLQGLRLIGDMISDPSPMDIALGILALTLTGTPKLLALLSRSSVAWHHSPYNDLAAAIRAMPNGAPFDAASTDESINLVLRSLQLEMSELIGENSDRRATDVTLLVFGNREGSTMEVRARTAAHENDASLHRPYPSGRFMAYYVAMCGRNYAEHNFANGRNPFPLYRITVPGSPPVTYRSVLFLPIMCASRPPAERRTVGGLLPDVVEGCIGVICVHSQKPYRFWRYGDHTKAAGGFADIAGAQAMPYIALLKRLLEPTNYMVRMETT